MEEPIKTYNSKLFAAFSKKPESLLMTTVSFFYFPNEVSLNFFKFVIFCQFFFLSLSSNCISSLSTLLDFSCPNFNDET